MGGGYLRGCPAVPRPTNDNMSFGKRDFTPILKTYTAPKGQKTVKKQRTDNTGKLRKELDIVFAKHIRGMSKKCFTCDSGKNDHCGHFMKRGNDGTRWNPDNCRPQCWTCNIEKGGNFDEFRIRLIKQIGLEKVEDVEQLSRIDVKFSPSELQEMIDKYKKP